MTKSVQLFGKYSIPSAHKHNNWIESTHSQINTDNIHPLSTTIQSDVCNENDERIQEEKEIVEGNRVCACRSRSIAQAENQDAKCNTRNHVNFFSTLAFKNHL